MTTLDNPACATRDEFIGPRTPGTPVTVVRATALAAIFVVGGLVAPRTPVAWLGFPDRSRRLTGVPVPGRRPTSSSSRRLGSTRRTPRVDLGAALRRTNRRRQPSGPGRSWAA